MTADRTPEPPNGDRTHPSWDDPAAWLQLHAELNEHRAELLAVELLRLHGLDLDDDA
jgi:hypothetical protein